MQDVFLDLRSRRHHHGVGASGLGDGPGRARMMVVQVKRQCVPKRLIVQNGFLE
jgi:hypothetical protein